jgi:hypothetical protein
MKKTSSYSAKSEWIQHPKELVYDRGSKGSKEVCVVHIITREKQKQRATREPANAGNVGHE